MNRMLSAETLRLLFRWKAALPFSSTDICGAAGEDSSLPFTWGTTSGRGRSAARTRSRSIISRSAQGITAITNTPQGDFMKVMNHPSAGLHQPALPIRAFSLMTVLSLPFTSER